ncbi:hypothetical protein FRX31_005712, partial [Thalictrum thalictroides]
SITFSRGGGEEDDDGDESLRRNLLFIYLLSRDPIVTEQRARKGENSKDKRSGFSISQRGSSLVQK